MFYFIVGCWNDNGYVNYWNCNWDYFNIRCKKIVEGIKFFIVFYYEEIRK